ncbi:hypothetical protein BLA29_002307 [Euroglyphus maynei]|uniref:Fatty acyl-CoA reductase n=1 Tax=Euroglyphus maynei TaxID=6958 RepID=A0A1Y3BC65_EURMA|nr:hypothetical protein BLA29_002307 [Euroglyphus maynei]
MCIDKKQSLSVVDFYANKTILITGSTGSIGQLLLEKLLRECSNVKRIYLIIRSKKSLSSQQRLKKMFSTSLLFEHHSLDKVYAIDGDLCQDNLGISDENYQKLCQEVQIVFHSAACVKFNGILGTFIEQNVKGTNRLMSLCEKMLKIESIVHVSTAFSNCLQKCVEEKIYSPPFDLSEWPDVDLFLKMLEKNFAHLAVKNEHPILNGHPNPYTFTKAITEWLVDQKYGHLPVIICRPSIVASTYREPLRGWMDKFFGYSGMYSLISTGIARSVIINLECKAEIIPADYVVNSLLICAAYRASTMFDYSKKVVHQTSCPENSITWQQMNDETFVYENKIPTTKLIRPVKKKFSNKYQTNWDKLCYVWTKLFNHYPFALFIDFICLITGNRPFLMRLTRIMHSTSEELVFFSTKNWCFQYKNNMEIYHLIDERERALFNCDYNTIDWPDFCYQTLIGGRRYLLKEPDSNIEQAKRRRKLLHLSYEFIYFCRNLFIIWIINTFIGEKILPLSSSSSAIIIENILLLFNKINLFVLNTCVFVY